MVQALHLIDVFLCESTQYPAEYGFIRNPQPTGRTTQNTVVPNCHNRTNRTGAANNADHRQNDHVHRVIKRGSSLEVWNFKQRFESEGFPSNLGGSGIDSFLRWMNPKKGSSLEVWNFKQRFESEGFPSNLGGSGIDSFLRWMNPINPLSSIIPLQNRFFQTLKPDPRTG